MWRATTGKVRRVKSWWEQDSPKCCVASLSRLLRVFRSLSQTSDWAGGAESPRNSPSVTHLNSKPCASHPTISATSPAFKFISRTIAEGIRIHNPLPHLPIFLVYVVMGFCQLKSANAEVRQEIQLSVPPHSAFLKSNIAKFICPSARICTASTDLPFGRFSRTKFRATLQ
jgi:hypothetical protein